MTESPFAIPRAQRLSASSEFSRCQRSSHRKVHRYAQRLSASSEFSLFKEVDHWYFSGLCSTPFGIIGILTFRTLSLGIRSLCSTPFAIIGILTAQLRRASVRVLS